MEPTSFQSSSKPISEYHYEPSSTYPKIRDKKKKPIFAVVAIAAILVVSGLSIVFIVFQNPEDEFDVISKELDVLVNNINSKIEGGPKASLYSLAGGNFQSIPNEGNVAKYYVYYDGEKIGETIEGTVGKETYNGRSCYKMLGRSNVEFSYLEQTIAFQMIYAFYEDENTKMPVYMTIKYDYSKPEELKEFDMIISLSWDQNSGEIKTSVQCGEQTGTSTAILPIEYWGMISSVDDLYVGFSEEIDYTMTTSVSGTSSDSDMNLKISITGQEDVTVPSGTFENCYVLEMEQTQSNGYSYSSTDVNMKIWISEDGFVPQKETSLSSMGMPLSITSKLEGYYTTI